MYAIRSYYGIDFYNKSFVFGLLLGICIIGYINYNYVIKFEYEIQLLSFAIIIVGVLNLLINQFPLYKHYRLALQNYLDNQSEKIVRSKSLFKNIESYKRYKGIQFVRFINLLNIINPLISRKAISETINSDDYFCQRFSIGKAADFIMLELHRITSYNVCYTKLLRPRQYPYICLFLPKKT